MSETISLESAVVNALDELITADENVENEKTNQAEINNRIQEIARITLRTKTLFVCSLACFAASLLCLAFFRSVTPWIAIVSAVMFGCIIPLGWCLKQREAELPSLNKDLSDSQSRERQIMAKYSNAVRTLPPEYSDYRGRRYLHHAFGSGQAIDAGTAATTIDIYKQVDSEIAKQEDILRGYTEDADSAKDEYLSEREELDEVNSRICDMRQEISRLQLDISRLDSYAMSKGWVK